jgi:hypothetical protein
MYRNAHRPAFYKRLHRYVHKRFRRGQAMSEWRKVLHGEDADLQRAFTAAYYLPAELWEGIRLERAR